MSSSKRRHRLRDYIIYLGIAVSLVTTIVLLAFEGYTPDESSFKWAEFGINTVIIFGYLIYWFRGSLRKIVFWSGLFVGLGIHTTVFALILRRVDRFPLVYYVALFPIELPLMFSFFRQLGLSPSRISESN